MLLTPTKVGMASKGILRRAPQEGQTDDKQKQRGTLSHPQLVRSAVSSSVSASSTDHMSLTAPLSLDSTTFHAVPASPTAATVVRPPGSHRMTSSSAVGTGQATAPVSRAGSTKALHALASTGLPSAMDTTASEASSSHLSSTTATAANNAANNPTGLGVTVN